MGILEEARETLIALCRARAVDRSRVVTIRPLRPDEAIGERADASFVIRKGREVVIHAEWEGAAGQAFTDAPSGYAGTLDDVLSLDLARTEHRAFLVAAMNAVLRKLGAASGTVHCRNEDPTRCGPEMAAELERRFGRKRYGLVGLQPAILRGLADRFGAEHVRAVDLNPENIGTRKSGVEIWDGATRLGDLVDWCEVVLATGSSVVNGTIDEVVRRAAVSDRSLVFFGNTISGVAALIGVDRICPFAQ